ncbi:MAG: hypothetical protein ABJA78_02770 [Ferruginibacter sp.]
MQKHFFILILSCIFVMCSVSADVRIEGSVTRLFSISNINKYPGYTFYYLHQSYHYDKGYQPNQPDTVAVENNKRYEAATHGDTKTTLMAVDAKGNWLNADVQIGGEATAGPQVNSIVDIYEISSMNNGLIKLKKIKEISVNKNGKEKEHKASGVFAFISNDTFSTGLSIFSILALGGLIIVFIVRKRKQEYHPATA